MGANSLDEAVKKVEDCIAPLPEKGEFIQDSFEVMYDVIENYIDEKRVKNEQRK